MSTIRVIYQEEPKFPSTAQHPDAIRYRVGNFWVDAIGGEPTQKEIDEVLNPKKSTQASEELALAIEKLSPKQQGVLKAFVKLIAEN